MDRRGDVADLADESYAKRLRAARRLRRGSVDGAVVLRSLEAEIDRGVSEDNWELVYHLVMKLAESDDKAAFGVVCDVACRPGLPPMVCVALGDAIVRLGRAQPGDPAPLLWCLEQQHPSLSDGAFQAAALLREVYDEATTEHLLRSLEGVESVEPVDTRRFWPAAAAAGWDGTAVEEFLRKCLTSLREDVREAASLSLEKKYKKWRVL